MANNLSKVLFQDWIDSLEKNCDKIAKFISVPEVLATRQFAGKLPIQAKLLVNWTS